MKSSGIAVLYAEKISNSYFVDCTILLGFERFFLSDFVL